ncbi:hypothetical protein [Clostridium thermosuccinogenes]|nr:hypothetical protein [Pseudoclostridium thermosuccinogenes]
MSISVLTSDIVILHERLFLTKHNDIIDMPVLIDVILLNRYKH